MSERDFRLYCADILDLEIVWKIVQDDLPPLMGAIKRFLGDEKAFL